MDIVHRKVPLTIILFALALLVIFGIFFARKVTTIAEDVVFLKATLFATPFDSGIK